MTVTFTGIGSVSDRVLFTDNGPIVKSPTPILTGSDLRVTSPSGVTVQSGPFTPSNVGLLLSISGSNGARNDGKFYIAEVLSPTSLVLEKSSFDTLDVAQTTNDVMLLANAIRLAYNGHVLSPSHQYAIIGDLVTAELAVDLTSICILLNQIKQQFNVHIMSLAGVHFVFDDADLIGVDDAIDLPSAIILANDLRKHFEEHRQFKEAHISPDEVNRVFVVPVVPTVGTFPSPLTGPFTWTLYEPNDGVIADSSDDVQVIVNGSPAPVEAVFGLLGAVVLTNKPGPTDSVSVSYDWIRNPSVQFQRLNSFEFNLNQSGNLAYSGLPQRKYKVQSYLLDPTSKAGLVHAPANPERVSWKYKGLERAYTAPLNDPNSLLLNTPNNDVLFQGVQAVVTETVIKYDPTTLPDASSDPWVLEGDASGAVIENNELVITHVGSDAGTSNLPPFYSHAVDFSYPSLTFAAFRAYIQSYTLDGDFTGVVFGISDGSGVITAGFLQADASELSTGIALANSIKNQFNAHVVEPHVHVQPDTQDVLTIVDATDLPSLVILTNALVYYYNRHLNKGIADNVHLSIDVADIISATEVRDLADALMVLNLLRSLFNTHLNFTGHPVIDNSLAVPKVKQVGVLTNRGYPEFQSSWNVYATDWSVYRTYRIFRDSDGNASLFLSDVSGSVIDVSSSDLPPLSSMDGKFDTFQQSFFGTIGKVSSSVSNWSFIRVNINPLDSDQVSRNKSVDYESLTVPEVDPNAPWIPIGFGGYERTSTNGLILDSVATVADPNLDPLGKSTGPYRGFVRLEPTFTAGSTCSLEFTGKIGYYTFSVDNIASGVYLDDDQLATHLVFIQANPSPASVTGQVSEPFAVDSGDTVILSVNNGSRSTITFGTDTTAASVVNDILAAAIPGVTASAVSGAVKIQTTSLGATSRIEFFGGDALAKLGLVPGTYFGADSQPEPKISWFGEDLPNLDIPQWSINGTQVAAMLGRTMRISDASLSDYLAYSLEETLITSQVFNPSVDWKVDFRLTSVSFTPGDTLNGLQFCGALVNVDEGPLGKNVEIELSVDSSGNPFIHIVSYEYGTDTLHSVVQFPFIWNDGLSHSFDLFTSKASSTMIVMGDGALVGTFPITSLYAGVFGPSISFGSGSVATSNTDQTLALSVFDWSSVCIFRDSRISNPLTVQNRYIGLYAGGDTSLLSSYRLAAVDWSLSHTYRIIRDPDFGVTVYIDGSQVPSISSSYDPLSLPPVSTSFLQKLSNNRPLIGFGSFNPKEIDRSYWNSVKYSIGKITQTNGIVPPHQVLNQGNAVVSPDHLFTTEPHVHNGFKVYSGGTPIDDFLSDQSVSAYTILGEGTAPVPMTQDLTSRGGLVQNYLSVSSVSATDIVNQRGFLSDFENDTTNMIVVDPVFVTQSVALASLVARANELFALYQSHRVRHQPSTVTPIHLTDDVANVPSSPVAIDLPTAVVRLNNLSATYGFHLVSPGVHIHDDSVNLVTVPVASDFDSAMNLANDLATKFSAHQSEGSYHEIDDTINNQSSITLNDVYAIIGVLATAYQNHLTQPGVHFIDDTDDTIIFPLVPVDLPSAIQLAQALVDSYQLHVLNFTQNYHGQMDIANQYQGNIPVDFENLLLAIDYLTGEYLAHIASGLPIHSNVDGINIISPNSPLKTFLDELTSFRNKLSKHRSHTPSLVPPLNPIVFHKYETQSRLRPINGHYNQPAHFVDWDSVNQEVNYLKADLNDHFANASHDFTDPLNVVATADAVDAASSFVLMTDTIAGFDAHIAGKLWHRLPSNIALDTPSSNSVIDPLAYAIGQANTLQTHFNAHLSRARSHTSPDESNLVLVQPATDLTSLTALANAIRLAYETHRANSHHVSPDLIDIVTAPAAVDLQTAGDLIADLITEFNLHLVSPGVHGSSVYIRLDAPDGVLYDDMEFFVSTTGQPDLVRPFSDNYAPSISGGLSFQNNNFLEYPGSAAPERAVIVTQVLAPYPIVGGDVLNLLIDRVTPVSVVFQATDTSSLNVINRINSAPGVTSIIASDPGDGFIRMVSPSSGSMSDIQVVGGSAVSKLGLTGVQPAIWSLISGDPDDVQVQLLNAGIIDFMRINTTTADNEAAYQLSTGLTDVTNSNFTIIFSIRVNAASVIDGATGVVVGIGGMSQPGFTAAFGFDLQLGVRYVILTDLNDGTELFRRPFDWGDGVFHRYQITKDTITNTLQIFILS